MFEPKWKQDANQVLDDLGQLASAVDRPDLDRLVSTARASLTGGPATIAVVGGYQTGKTSLVSALLGLDVAPVGPDGTTPAPLLLSYSDEASVIVGRDQPEQPCTVEDIPSLLRTGWGSAPPSEPPGPAAAFLPSPLLADGLALIDTPGSPGFGGGAVAAAVSALPVADAVMLVTTATQPMTSAEVALATTLAGSGQPLLVAVAKADLQVAWPHIVSANRDALAASGVDVPIVAVSAPVRRAAIDAGDDALDEESGADTIVEWMLDVVVDRVADHRRQRVLHDARSAVESLREPLMYELSALTGDGTSVAETLRALEARARDLQTGAARWNQELTDLMTDLRNAAEADVRRRGLAVLAAANERIEQGDPADDWGGFGGWLEEETAAAMTDHLAWRHERLVDAVDRSAETFGHLLAGASGNAVLSAVAANAALAAVPKRVSVRTSLYATLRNSYGGMMMFGFLGSVAGFVLSAPVTVGIGLVLGSKSYRTERVKQLAQRRAAAKDAVRIYIETTWGAFGAEAKAQLVKLQRQVRDDLAAHVDQVREDTRVAYEAARSSAVSDRDERTRREAGVRERLAALDDFSLRLAALDGLTVGAAA